MTMMIQMSKDSLDLAFDRFMSRRRPIRRRDDFEPYTEPFRELNEEEIKSTYRFDMSGLDSAPKLRGHNYSEMSVSYQAIPGGFTICNILLNNRLYSGASHCIKSDRWLAIRGKMTAFRRALEQSQGVEIPQSAQSTQINPEGETK